MGTVNANRTGYTPASSASTTSMQWNSDMYLGNHLGVAQFNTSINSLTGLSASGMNLINFIDTCRVSPVNEGTISGAVTVSIGSTVPNYKGSSLPTNYSHADLTGSSTTSGAYSHYNIRAMLNSPNGTSTNLTPTSNPIYVCFKKSTSNRFHNTTEDSKPCQLTLTAQYKYSNVGTPGTPTITYSGTTATVTWGASSGGTNTSVASYYVYLTTSSGGGVVAGKSATVTTTSATFTNVTGGTMGSTTIYARVCANSSPAGYGSGYAQSAAKSIMAHPTVSAGAIITKAQMDSLRTYKGNSPAAVTQGGIIYASTGNAYKASSVSAGGIVYASWYNGA